MSIIGIPADSMVVAKKFADLNPKTLENAKRQFMELLRLGGRDVMCIQTSGTLRGKRR
jgi:hypothetical protein